MNGAMDRRTALGAALAWAGAGGGAAAKAWNMGRTFSAERLAHLAR